MRESSSQKHIWKRASELGARLFRNNVGAFQDKDGRWIQFGVFGKGGHDLVGWLPVVITQEHVGKTIAQFLTVECKGARGRPTKDQLRVMAMVQKAGGISGVASTIKEVEDIILGVAK